MIKMINENIITSPKDIEAKTVERVSIPNKFTEDRISFLFTDGTGAYFKVEPSEFSRRDKVILDVDPPVPIVRKCGQLSDEDWNIFSAEYDTRLESFKGYKRMLRKISNFDNKQANQLESMLVDIHKKIESEFDKLPE